MREEKITDSVAKALVAIGSTPGAIEHLNIVDALLDISKALYRIAAAMEEQNERI